MVILHQLARTHFARAVSVGAADDGVDLRARERKREAEEPLRHLLPRHLPVPVLVEGPERDAQRVELALENLRPVFVR